MTNILLQAKEVSSIKPRGFGKKAFRLQGINFILPNGYIMGIVGKNGAGKTTFFDYICGEKKKREGRFLRTICGHWTG